MENERETPKVNKWYTISLQIDIETGEILSVEKYGKLIPLTKSEVERLGYYKIRYEKQIEIVEQYNSKRIRERIGYIKYYNLCRESKQGRLF